MSTDAHGSLSTKRLPDFISMSSVLNADLDNAPAERLRPPERQEHRGAGLVELDNAPCPIAPKAGTLLCRAPNLMILGLGISSVNPWSGDRSDLSIPHLAAPRRPVSSTSSWRFSPAGSTLEKSWSRTPRFPPLALRVVRQCVLRDGQIHR